MEEWQRDIPPPPPWAENVPVEPSPGDTYYTSGRYMIDRLWEADRTGRSIETRTDLPPKVAIHPDKTAKLRKIVRGRKITNGELAKHIGLGSPSSVGNRLNGKEAWRQGEFERVTEYVERRKHHPK